MLSELFPKVTSNTEVAEGNGGATEVNLDFRKATVHLCDRQGYEINNFTDQLIPYPQSIHHCLLPKKY